ncbi:hypothetical protein NKH18_51410 [Streptomyces sp. M10(2022)]
MASPTAHEVDCGELNLSQADWVEHCSESQESPAATASPKDLELGGPSLTVGDRGIGELEVTPTTLVYAKEGAARRRSTGRSPSSR